MDLAIGPREYVSIVGASGSGKKHAALPAWRPRSADAGLTPNSSICTPSRVLLEGFDTAALGDAQLASLRNEKLGFVFQFHYLLHDFTAQENVCLPMLKLARLCAATPWTGRPAC